MKIWQMLLPDDSQLHLVNGWLVELIGGCEQSQLEQT
jgi:hypothetical protein